MIDSSDDSELISETFLQYLLCHLQLKLISAQCDCDTFLCSLRSLLSICFDNARINKTLLLSSRVHTSAYLFFEKSFKFQYVFIVLILMIKVLEFHQNIKL